MFNCNSGQGQLRREKKKRVSGVGADALQIQKKEKEGGKTPVPAVIDAALGKDTKPGRERVALLSNQKTLRESVVRRKGVPEVGEKDDVWKVEAYLACEKKGIPAIVNAPRRKNGVEGKCESPQLPLLYCVVKKRKKEKERAVGSRDRPVAVSWEQNAGREASSASLLPRKVGGGGGGKKGLLFLGPPAARVGNFLGRGRRGRPAFSASCPREKGRKGSYASAGCPFLLAYCLRRKRGT